MSIEQKTSLTVLLPAGRLPLELMARAHKLAEKYSLKVYVSNAQNLKIVEIPEAVLEDVKASLALLGASFKEKGKFPLPKVCEGRDYCNLGTIDTEAFSVRLMEKFSGRKHTKPKFKIAISGCAMCCSGAKTADIGIIGTPKGFEMYAGGKGGSSPEVGIRIGSRLQQDEVIDMVETLVEFHDKKTENKQRIHTLLSDPEFPYPEM